MSVRGEKERRERGGMATYLVVHGVCGVQGLKRGRAINRIIGGVWTFRFVTVDSRAELAPVVRLEVTVF